MYVRDFSGRWYTPLILFAVTRGGLSPSIFNQIDSSLSESVGLDELYKLISFKLKRLKPLMSVLSHCFKLTELLIAGFS